MNDGSWQISGGRLYCSVQVKDGIVVEAEHPFGWLVGKTMDEMQQHCDGAWKLRRLKENRDGLQAGQN